MSTLALLIHYLGVLSLALGSLAVVLGALGLVRLDDVYQRMHGTGIVDTGGAGLILFGLLMFSPDWTVTVRLILIGFILVMTGPTATHAIARAVRVSGNEPDNVKPKPKNTTKKKTAKKTTAKSKASKGGRS